MKGASAPRMRSLLHVFGFLLISSACTRYVPPPPPPEPVRPATIVADDKDEASFSDEIAEVTISTDVPALVEHAGDVTRSFPLYRGKPMDLQRSSYDWRVLCATTPCTAHLRRGQHRLSFRGLADRGRTSTVTISVRDKIQNVAHTLGQERTSTGTILGAALFTAGLAALIFPFGVDFSKNSRAPPVLVGAGIAGVFGGLTLMNVDASIRQPGATTTWGGNAPRRDSWLEQDRTTASSRPSP